jgi:hypothetical protein
MSKLDEERDKLLLYEPEMLLNLANIGTSFGGVASCSNSAYQSEVFAVPCCIMYFLCHLLRAACTL